MFTGFFALLRLPGLAQICPKKPMEYQMAVSNGNDREMTEKMSAVG
jgi:hypothetical protein